MKKLLAVLVCITLLFLCSCSARYENVTFQEDDDKKCVLYAEEKYFAVSFFEATERHDKANETDIELGWYYSFPFSTRFYSYTSEKPFFIYSIGSDTDVYVRHDFDYRMETFVVDGTGLEIVFSDALTPSDDFVYDMTGGYSLRKNVTLCYKLHPSLRARLNLFYKDGAYYAGGIEGTLFKVSDEFAKLIY